MSVVSDIPRLIIEAGNAQSAGNLAAARAMAEGQRQQGAIWGQTLQSLGQTIAGIPGQYQQAKQQEQQSKIGAQQLQMGDLSLRQARQGEADDMAIRDILSRHKGDIDAALPEILAASPLKGAAIQKQVLEGRKTVIETQKAKLDSTEKALTLGTQILNGVDGPDSYAWARKAIAGMAPDLGERMPEQYDPAVVERLKAAGTTVAELNKRKHDALTEYIELGKYNRGTPEFVEKATKMFGQYLSGTGSQQEWQQAIESAPALGIPASVVAMFPTQFSPDNRTKAGQLAMTPKERVDVAETAARLPLIAAQTVETSARAPLIAAQTAEARARIPLIRAQTAAAGRSGSGSLTAADAQLVDAIIANPTIFGTLTPTVKTRLATALSEKGFTFQNAGKPATGAQNKVLGFFNRAKQADDDLQGLEEKVAKMSYLEQERMKRAPNLLQTQTGQSYNQAQRAFTEARLRKDSGAAIPETEFENDRVTYFAQPGDTASTLDQKRRARAAVLSSLSFEAGPAFEQFYGDDAPALAEGYKSRAKGATQPATNQPAEIWDRVKRAFVPNPNYKPPK